MKSFWAFTLEHILLFEACLLQYSRFINAELISNQSSVPSTSSSPPTSTLPDCGTPSCSIIIYASTLTYPYPIHESTQHVTATVIPIVYTYSDGRRSTTSSTYNVYNPTSNQTWTAPESSDLTWENLGTTFTYPTTYIAYPSPDLILNVPDSVSGSAPAEADCIQEFNQIPIPPSLTKSFIFTYNASAGPTPSASVIFSIVDTLPTVTSLIGGGDPRTCSHGTPARTIEATNIPFAPVVHTTVSVLTEVGQQVTLAADPFGHGPETGNSGSQGVANGGSGTTPEQQVQGTNQPSSGSNSGSGSGSGSGSSSSGSGSSGSGSSGSGSSGSGSSGSGSSGSGSSSSESGSSVGSGSGPGSGLGSGSGSGSSPSPVTINGQIITPAPLGGVIVSGSTILPGSSGTIAGGIAISVASSGGGVAVGSSTVTLSSGAGSYTGKTSSSSTGVGAAVASGIGATRNNALRTNRFGTAVLEGSVLAMMFRALRML